MTYYNSCNEDLKFTIWVHHRTTYKIGRRVDHIPILGSTTATDTTDEAMASLRGRGSYVNSGVMHAGTGSILGRALSSTTLASPPGTVEPP